jgi:thiosulfate reductase cytochrome b subunit
MTRLEGRRLKGGSRIVKAVQNRKAEAPMVVTVSGREIFGRERQFKNALAPIVVRFGVLHITAVRFVHPEKALGSMVVTFVCRIIVVSSDWY